MHIAQLLYVLAFTEEVEIVSSGAARRRVVESLVYPPFAPDRKKQKRALRKEWGTPRCCEGQIKG